MSISIVEATLSDLQHLLSTHTLTSIDLVAIYLHRIATYDIRGPCLNSIPILNPHAFSEAAASDARRSAGKSLGPLDGIPYTLKDSMKYAGQRCATGSPAFKNLVANEDSFVAEQLRKAGAICIGRTNTPPMMASGMHRGLHGRAESPYNLDYLTAAFSSGSSNGSATSTAASFAAFSLGSETVSSGRSPASNNGLVAYTPSRTVISPRGCWPLYPTCDVLVPHTRTVEDMLQILDVLTVVDERKDEDFWRLQKYIQIEPVVRPASYPALKDSAKGSLKGKRIAIPKMYIGQHDAAAQTTYVSQDVISLWNSTRKDLEALGAGVIETDLPLVTNYESGPGNNVVGFLDDWNSKERGELVAYLWDDFLKSNSDPNYPSLASIDGSKMFPRPKGYVPDKYMEHKNFMDYPRLVEIARSRPKGKSIWDIEGIVQALPALEAQRKRDLEDWMDTNSIDVVVFPAQGDVGRSDVDTNDSSAKHALLNGVKYSNGNRAIRHMGVPTVSVCMGLLEESKMPMNLTFAGKHGQDKELLEFAYEFEQATKRRVAPPVTPALESDRIVVREEKRGGAGDSTPIEIEITSAERVGENEIQVTGKVNGNDQDISVEPYVDGKQVKASQVQLSSNDKNWSFRSAYTPFEPAKPLYGGVGQVVNNVLVVILARSTTRVAGSLVLIDQKAVIKG